MYVRAPRYGGGDIDKHEVVKRVFGVYTRKLCAGVRLTSRYSHARMNRQGTRVEVYTRRYIFT